MGGCLLFTVVMPYTVAFVDTGKPKPERYTVSLKRQLENSIVRGYAKSTLRTLVKANRKGQAQRTHKKLDQEHHHRQWDFEKIRSIMAAKLLSRVKRPEQTMREAYSVFGVSAGNGITKPMFARALRNLGLNLTPAEINDTFDHLDADGGGFIDFEEMVQECFAPDYSRKTWNAKRCEQIASKKHTHVAPDEPNFPASIAAFRPSTEQHELWLRRALMARARRPQDQVRVAFHMFGRPKHGITLPIFMRVLRRLGMSLTRQEGIDLMARYDNDGSGKLDFNEFARGLMGLDYSEKMWNEKRGEAIENATLARKLHVDVDVIDRHKQQVLDFRYRRHRKNKQAERDREMRLREERDAVMRKHRRRAERAERAKRLSGVSLGNKRHQSAGRTRMADHSLIYEHAKAYLPAEFHMKGSSPGTMATSINPTTTMKTMMVTTTSNTKTSKIQRRPKSASVSSHRKKHRDKHTATKTQTNNTTMDAAESPSVRKKLTRPQSSSPSQRRLRKALSYSSTHLAERIPSHLHPNRRRRPRTAHSVANLIRTGVPKSMAHDFGFRC